MILGQLCHPDIFYFIFYYFLFRNKNKYYKSVLFKLLYFKCTVFIYTIWKIENKINRNKNNNFLADVHNTAPTQPFFMFHSLNLSQLR